MAAEVINEMKVFCESVRKYVLGWIASKYV
jgi:hypothetical protein